MCRNVFNISIRAGLVLLCLLALSPSSVSAPQNRVTDLHTMARDQGVKLMFSVGEEPNYQLKLKDQAWLILTLYDASGDPVLQERLRGASGETSVSMEEEGPNLRFHIKFGRSIREVRGAWLPEQRLLCLELFWSWENQANGRGSASAIQLQDIRFGPESSYTRVVMELSHKPSWELRSQDLQRMNLRLSNTSSRLKGKSYGPMRRLTSVGLDQSHHDLDLQLQLEGRSTEWRLFWLHAGNRLVMDLYDHPTVSMAADIFLPQELGHERPPEKPYGEEEASKEIHALLDPPVQSENPKPSQDQRGEQVRPEGEASLAELQKGDTQGPTIKKTIRGRVISPAEESMPEKIEKRVMPKLQRAYTKIERALRDRFEGLFGEDELPSGLNAEEAVLYGRILEALNFKDYERGTVLIQQFQKEYPESTAAERIAFLKGDFYFSLLESGRKETLSEVVTSYEEAMARFGESKEVPETYLKLAQANRMAGNDYQALGYLNHLIAGHENHELLTVALMERGKIQLKGSNPEGGLEDLREVLQRDPHSELAEEVRYEIAKHFHEQGLYREAEEKFMEMEGQRSDFSVEHPESLSMRARNHLYLRDYTPARELYFRALNVGGQPETVDLLLTHIGDTYLHESKEREAQSLYHLVLEEFPHSEGASVARLRLADADSEVEDFKEVGEENQNLPIGELATLKMANAYIEKRMYPEAMESLADLVAGPPKNEIRKAAIQVFLTAAQEEMKRLYIEKRHEELTSVFRAHENLLLGKIEADVELLVGQSLYQLERYVEAGTAFERLEPIDLSPETKGTYYLGLANTYRGQGELEKAVKVLETNRKPPVTATDQQRMAALLADIYREKGTMKDAFQLYDELVNGERLLSNGEIARIYFSMGQILNGEGKHEKAREVLNKCIALVEKKEGGKELFLSAIAEVGDSYRGEGRHGKAAKVYEEALNTGYGPEMEGYWDLKFKLAESYLQTGQASKAETHLKQISEEGDPHLLSKVQIRLGSIYLEEQLKRLSIWSELEGDQSVHVGK